MLFFYPVIILGSMGAGALTALLYPFDVMKTHLQLQQELVRVPFRFTLASRKKHMKSVLNSYQDFRKKQDFRMLRIGALPMFFISGGSTILRLSSYQIAYETKWLSPDIQDVLKIRAIIFCGMWGSLQQVLSNPFQIIKTKMQCWSISSGSVLFRPVLKNLTMWKVGKLLNKTFGWRIFLAGWRASMYRGFMAAVVQLVVYENAKYRLVHPFRELPRNRLFKREVIAAMTAGMGSTVLVAPFDMVLTRVHAQPYMLSRHGLYYKGFADCMRKIVVYEGVHGLYKGGFFLWLRHGLMSTLGILYWDVWKDDLKKTIVLFT